MSETKTVIGEGAVVRGQVEGAEDLHVMGRLEGSIALTETLVIGPEGVIHADVTARNVVLQGLLVGNIDATGSVQIASGGRMVGDIRAPEVMIDEGGALRGLIDMGEFDLETPERLPASRDAARAMSVTAPSRGTSPRAIESRGSTYSQSVNPDSVPKQSVSAPSSWSEPPVSRAPVPAPRPSVAAASPAKRPAAPPPKLRNIGRAKARRVPR